MCRCYRIVGGVGFGRITSAWWDDCRAFGGVGDEVVYGVLYCKKLRIGGGV